MTEQAAAPGAARRPEQQRDTRLRFEQWAKNPRCEANTMSAVHNIRMAKVAKEAAGVEPTFGASPFALARGEQFERNLLANAAERLIPELVRTEVLPEGAAGLRDLRIRMNGGLDPALRTLDQACEETLELLRQVGAARGDAAAALDSVVAAATLKLPGGVMLPEALLIIDVLAVRPQAGTDRAEVLIGEVKTYPDRGGYTDRGQLAQARAQLGLYLHALRTVTETFPESERPHFSEQGFLVLSRPGSDFPRVRAGEELRYQAGRADRGFARLEDLALALPATFDLDADDEPERLNAVLHAEKHYSESCLGFCDLVAYCHAQALAAESAMVLGDDVDRFVGGLPLSRVGELLDGAAPVDETERELVDRIRAAEEPGWD